MPQKGKPCAVATCKMNLSNSPEVSFHRFPRDPELRQLWILRTQRADFFNPDTARICSLHFAPDDFQSDMRAKIMGTKPKAFLKPNAVPSVSLGKKEVIEEVSSPDRTYSPFLTYLDIKTEPISPKSGQEDFFTWQRSTKVEMKTIGTTTCDLMFPTTSSLDFELAMENLRTFNQLLTSKLERKREKLRECRELLRAFKGSEDLNTNLNTYILPRNEIIIKDECENRGNNNEVESKVSAMTNFPKILQCSLCPSKTSTINNFLSHVKKHENGIFKCPLCDFQTENCLKSISAHMRGGHFDQVPVSHKNTNCCFCGKSFNWPTHLQRHIKRQHSNDVEHFICDFCGKKMSTKGSLKLHIRIHTGEKPDVCEVCGKAFRTLTLLSGHKQTHEVIRKRPFMCENCGKTFRVKAQLGLHLETHLPKLFYCELCSIRFKTEKTLKKHVEKGHFACSICKRGFANCQSLKQHLLSHEKLKKFKCEDCKRQFLCKSSRNKHYKYCRVRNGGNLKRYYCEFCTGTFSHLTSLSNHILKHQCRAKPKSLNVMKPSDN